MSEACKTRQPKSIEKEDVLCEKCDEKEDVLCERSKEKEECTVKVKDSEIDKLTGSLRAVTLNDELQNELKALQCPFTWELKEEIVNMAPYDVRTRLIEKEEELEGDDGPYMILRNFGLQLAICYLAWREGDFTAAYERQCNGERLIEDCRDLTIMEGLKHISRSVLAYLEYESGKLTECQAILKTIVPYANFDNANKACVSGIRAIVLMEYGYQGTRFSLPFIEEALDLNPSNAEWHFLLGKSLRRVRKVESYNEIPEHRELKALEKAAEMSCCAGYYVFLAQAYRETAFRVYSINKNNFVPFKEIVNTMNTKSAEYYRKALEMSPDSSHINIRCALGFLNLPYPYKDEDLVRICLNKALKLSPTNAMVHHVLGKYYERVGDFERAKSSYETSAEYGAFGAFMDLIRVEFRMNQEYNPIHLLKKVLDTFKEERYRCEVMSQMTSYYYLKENDLKKAVSCLLEVVEDGSELISVLKNHKPLFTNIKKPLDLLHVIIDESRLALNKENISSEETDLYRRLISKYEGTELVNSAPKAHRTDILEHSDKIDQKEAKSQPYVRGRGRGQQRGHSNYSRQQGGRAVEHRWQKGREKFEVRCDEADVTSKKEGKYHYTKPHSSDTSFDSNSNRQEFWRNRNVLGRAVGDPNFEIRNTHRDWRDKNQIGASSYISANSTEDGNINPSLACGNDNIEDKLRIRKEMSIRMKKKNDIPD